MYAVEQDHWWYRSLHENVLTALRRFGALSGRSVLDAGCGTGQLAVRLQERGATVTALDYSPEALRLSARRGLPNLVEGSVNALPFPDANFDLVTSLDVLCHANVDDTEALREFLRVVRPGGCIVLNLPAYEWVRGHHDLVVQNARRYTRHSLEAKLAATGFVVEHATYWNTILFPAVAATRLLSRRKKQDTDETSDVGPVPTLLNQLLYLTLALERAWMRVFSLPFGLSILIVAKKPEGSPQ